MSGESERELELVPTPATVTPLGRLALELERMLDPDDAVDAARIVLDAGWTAPPELDAAGDPLPVIFNRPRVQVQPVVQDVDGGQVLSGFWLKAIESEGPPLEAHVPVDVAAMRLMLAAVGDYLESATAVEPEAAPNAAGELVVAPASAIAQLGRQARRAEERRRRG